MRPLPTVWPAAIWSVPDVFRQWWQVPRMLAVRYWRHRLGRLMLMLAGIAAGVGVLFGVLLVNDALKRTNEGWLRGTVGWSDIQVVSTAHGGLSEAWLQQVHELHGVGVASPMIENRSYLFKDESESSVTVRGVDPKAEELMRPFSLSAGRELEPGDTGVVLLSYAAAVALQAGPGTDVQLMTPFGLEKLRVVGVFHPFGDSAGVGERSVQMPLRKAQQLFAGGRQVITRIDVAVAGAEVEEVEASLNQLFSPLATVRRTSDAHTDLAQASAGVRAMLLITGVLGVLAAALLILVHLRMIGAERYADLRLLQVLGVTAARVRAWLIIEMGVLVTLGSIPAVMFAGPAASAVLTNLPTQMLPFAATAAAPRLGSAVLSGQATAALVAVGLLAVCAWYLLSRLLEAVARQLVGARRLAPWLRIGGHLLMPRVGQAASVAAVVAFTMAGIIGVNGAAESSRKALTNWLDRTVTWDALVATGTATSGVSVALPFDTVERLAGMPGVQAVAAERRAEVPSRSGPITMIALHGYGLELGNRLQILQAADLTGSAMWLSLREGRGVAVSAPLASRLNLAVGDMLPLSTDEGESEFTVVALVQDSASGADAAYIALDNYSSLWGDHSVDTVTLRLTPGAETAALVDAVTSVNGSTQQVPLRVTLASAYRSELLAAVDDSFRAARLMALLAFVVALAALITCNLAGAWQARPELLELRTLGASGNMLARLVLLELSVVGGVSAAAGVLLGTLFAARLSRSTYASSSAAWAWPLEAYVSIGGLLVVSALIAAVLMAGRNRLAPR